MAERIMRWSVPLDNNVHHIGWGDICYLDIADMPATVMRVFTIERVDDGDALVIPPEREVQLFESNMGSHAPVDLPELSEYLGGATCTHTSIGPSVYHLCAVGDGVGPYPDSPDYFSTSATTPEGTITVSIFPEPGSEGVNYSKVLNGGIEHMRFLLATGVED